MQHTARRVFPLITSLLVLGACGDDDVTFPGLQGGSGGTSSGQGGSASGGGPSAGGQGGSAGSGLQPDAGGCALGEVTVYQDLDGDGRHGAEQVSCIGATPPEGFDETSVGPDADDTDPRSWTQSSLDNCRDEDGDGYFIGCDQPPLAAADCDDDAGFIRPGGIESLGVNFDCDPSTSVVASGAQGVFIAPTGSDSEPCGTAAAPCQSFGKAEALLEAEPAGSERRFIFAAAGQYDEQPLVLRHSAIGGFSVSGAAWTRAAFNARPETAAALSVFSSATTGQQRLGVSGDGLVLDGIGVAGPPFAGDCTGVRVLAPEADAPSEPRGVLFVHGHIHHDCGADSSNLSALGAGYRLFLARTTVELAGDVMPRPANVHVVDLSPSADPWLEELEVSLAQAADSRSGVRVTTTGSGVTAHLRKSRIYMAGAPYGSASYGVQLSGASLVSDRLLVSDDSDTTTGALHWGMWLGGSEQEAVRADLWRSRLDVQQTALGLDQAQAIVVQSLLDSSAGAALDVGSGGRATVVHGLLRARGTAPAALVLGQGAGEVTVANSIIDVQAPAGAVTGIRSAGSGLRLLSNVFSLDGDTPANECPVDVAGALCSGGLALNECNTWSSCSQSAGNLLAALSYEAGGSPGGLFEAWHLPAGSPCIDLGQAPHALLPLGVPWLRSDVDGDVRPSGAGWDVGLDERPAAGGS